MTEMFNYVNQERIRPLISDDVYKWFKIMRVLDSHIIYNRDFNYDYFGFKTLEILFIEDKQIQRDHNICQCVFR
jgi:ribonucleoside-diphosphate reductase alpha chain